MTEKGALIHLPALILAANPSTSDLLHHRGNTISFKCNQITSDSAKLFVDVCLVQKKTYNIFFSIW